MQRIIVDTNVLVSALLRPSSPPGRILDLILEGELQPVFDSRIIAEYSEVLSRPKFDFDAGDIASLLDYVRGFGILIEAEPVRAALPDAGDLPFVEVAQASGAPIITGNLRHYPAEVVEPLGIVATSPAEFVRSLGKKS